MSLFAPGISSSLQLINNYLNPVHTHELQLRGGGGSRVSRVCSWPSPQSRTHTVRAYSKASGRYGSRSSGGKNRQIVCVSVNMKHRFRAYNSRLQLGLSK